MILRATVAVLTGAEMSAKYPRSAVMMSLLAGGSELSARVPQKRSSSEMGASIVTK